MDERATGQPLRFEHYRVATDEQGRPLKLGEGAMGVTYLAEDTNLKVRVALKVIRPQLLGDAEVGQRFQREAQAAARLRHPNVAGVYHLGMVDNTFFYAMEFVEGETVKDRVQRGGPMPVKEALEVTLQVCEALGAAEKHKMVHRDIKPANIMLEPVEEDILRVKLIDFGLAKPLHAEAQNSMALQTQAGIFLGTPVFASPEQVQDVPPDSRSDFYALGLTLWYMLEGRTPFEGSLHKVLFDQVHTAPPLGRLLWVPAEVRDLLGKLLEKEPVNRPQTAKELRQKIHDCLRALATSGTSYTEWQQRFQVEGNPRNKPWGMIYEGQDTLSGAVRLHLLRNDRFSDPKAVQGVIADARRAIDIHHPNILRHLTVFPTSGGQGAGWMVVTEHPGNQTLLDHLRKVKQLPLAEAIGIIHRLASAIDTCIANDLITADLDPAGIFLKHVPRTEMHPLTQTASSSVTATSSAVTSLTTETFEVVPKLSPINYSFLTTLRPADETAIGLTQGPFRMEATTPQELVQRLALLAYQCLGGAVPSTWSRVPRFIPLATLSQRQNDTLRTALTDSTWTRAEEFVEALQQTRATRRTDETSRITTSAEATVMLTSWRMLADLAAADSSEFSTEHAKEFTGKIEKQNLAPSSESGSEPAAGTEPDAAPSAPEAEATPPVEEAQQSPATTSSESSTSSSATVQNSTPGVEQTQTWNRGQESTEPAAEAKSPNETETIILPSRTTSQRLETAASPEIKEEEKKEDNDNVEATAAAESTTEKNEAEAPADTSALSVTASSGLAEDDLESSLEQKISADAPVPPTQIVESSVTDATTSTNGFSAPAAESREKKQEEEEGETEAQQSETASSTLTFTSTSSSSIAELFEQQDTAEEASPASASNASVEDDSDTVEASSSTAAAASEVVTTTPPSSPSSSEIPSTPPSQTEGTPTITPLLQTPTVTSAIPLPPVPPVSSAPTAAAAPKAKRSESEAKQSALPRWLLPAAGLMVAAALITGVALWMLGDKHQIDDRPPDAETPPVVVTPPQPPPPPPGPTLGELLTTAGSAAATGEVPVLDETLGKIRERFPNQSWDTDPAASVFREKLFRAYRDKTLGDGTEAARRYHDILLTATLARESDIPLLKQICTDLSSPSDAARAEPFEKALLNSLAADSSRKEERMREALALLKKGPDSTVTEQARGILSAELKECVDFLEQVPRDDSQDQYLKNAIPVLEPHLQEIANAGVAEAYYILGDKAYRADRRTEAERYFDQGAELLHGPCMRRYGNALTNYVGSRPPDMKAAAYYLKNASAQNDVKAKLLLADIYLPKHPTESQPWKGREGAELLIEAMKDGVSEGEYLYGAMLTDFKPDDPSQPFAPELTGKKRWDQALGHLRNAVAKGLSQAYPVLAMALLKNPHGKDISGAKDILEKGIKLNPPNPYCMLYLSGLISGNHSDDGRPFKADEVASAGILADPIQAEKLRMDAIKILREAAERKEAHAIRWCELNGIPYRK
ncbi:protein kinase [Roseimicrobium sp. ORNL1]|uniref:protein kinase domain-containing protein n=1 Tax=Roseimicrobium sp. ORNL1 TaxID=2711231 RepID=UPI0013E19442|nr:protein kinase [Roseimicrobium sp. ORNL1]QIF04750.1 protein kinase [Roseimicrobium sp. ORNL1]